MVLFTRITRTASLYFVFLHQMYFYRKIEQQFILFPIELCLWCGLQSEPVLFILSLLSLQVSQCDTYSRTLSLSLTHTLNPNQQR